MSVIVKTEKELGRALKDGDDEIIIEGDLAKQTFRIRAIGNVAWVVAAGAIAVAAITVLGTGGAALPAAGLVTAPAVIILGSSATAAAIWIAVAAGGVAGLATLRSYKEVERTSQKLVLKKD
jgi:hypothetical protein